MGEGQEPFPHFPLPLPLHPFFPLHSCAYHKMRTEIKNSSQVECFYCFSTRCFYIPKQILKWSYESHRNSTFKPRNIFLLYLAQVTSFQCRACNSEISPNEETYMPCMNVKPNTEELDENPNRNKENSNYPSALISWLYWGSFVLPCTLVYGRVPPPDDTKPWDSCCPA